MRRRPYTPRRAVALVWLAAVLVAAGCGGDGGGSTADGTSPTATASSLTPTASSTETTQTLPPTSQTRTTTTAAPEPKPKRKNIIAWILGLGPGAPSGPPEFTAYRELQKLRCVRVFDRVGELREPARTLYTGAAQACLAAFQGQSSRWPKAEQAYQDVSGKTSQLNCMDLAALGLLQRLVGAHEQHPDRSFVLAGTNTSKAPPCPTITRLEPDHGVQGATVTIVGRYLSGKNVVGIDVVDSMGTRQPGEHLTPVQDGLQFTMPEEPPPEASATVCVVVRADPDWNADGAFFTYDSETTAAPQNFACPPKAEE